MARAWYVKGRKLAFPNGTRLCSGPFDHGPDAFTEAARIRPFYPDATLEVVLHTGKTLPERVPRSAPPGAEPEAPMFDLRNIDGRHAAAETIEQRALWLGARVTVEVWDGEPDVSVSVPSLNCNIWLAWTPAAPVYERVPGRYIEHGEAEPDHVCGPFVTLWTGYRYCAVCEAPAP